MLASGFHEVGAPVVASIAAIPFRVMPPTERKYPHRTSGAREVTAGIERRALDPERPHGAARRRVPRPYRAGRKVERGQPATIDAGYADEFPARVQGRSIQREGVHASACVRIP